MKENEVTAIIKEKTDSIKNAYKDTLNILDAYDHQTLTRPEGTYYDGDETIEEVAVDMLYDMIKNPVWYDCDKQMSAIKFLLFLDWNDALFVDGEKRISDALLAALILVIEKSIDEEREMIIRMILNCICEFASILFNLKLYKRQHLIYRVIVE